MKKVMVLKHVPFEVLGTITTLLEKNFLIKYVDFGKHPNSRPNLKGSHALIILGGTMSANDCQKHKYLDVEVELIKKAIEKNIPVLGICLGAQLIAKALGARVYKNDQDEIGWYPLEVTRAGKEDKVMQHFNDVEQIFQWHSDTYDLPKGAVHLATTKDCQNQAFRVQENIYGFQFHLEVDKALIDRWLKNNIKHEELEDISLTANKIQQDCFLYLKRNLELAELTFSEFIKLI